MPLPVKRVVGSSSGTSLAREMTACPVAPRCSRNALRIWSASMSSIRHPKVAGLPVSFATEPASMHARRMRPLVDLVLVVALLALAGLAVLAARTEPRRWRVGVLLVGALWAAVAAAGVDPLLLPCVGAVLLGLLFLANGLQALRPAGRSRTTLLSLTLGLAVVAATVAGLGVVHAGASVQSVLAAVVLLLPGYPGLALLSYLLYCLAYGRRRPRPAPTAVIVLGSGLVDGTVPRLLARRLDAALHAWRGERSRGHHPLVVPSGGQGDDEPMAEGVAMTAYLVAHGVPPECVATEDRATTTEETLLLSRETRRPRGRGGAGHVRGVPSAFHAGRSALLARRLGIDADVTGAPTAWHFVPAAFLREFIAALALHPRTNLAGLGVWAASTAVLAYAAAPG